MLWSAMLSSPRSWARFRILSVNGPWNIAGKSVKISKCICLLTLAYMCYNSIVASYWQVYYSITRSKGSPQVLGQSDGLRPFGDLSRLLGFYDDYYSDW